MVTRREQGFTLVEVVLVLAITGLLLIIVVRGFSASRNNAQFSQAVDGAKESVAQFKSASAASINVNEAGNTANHNGIGLGTVPCHVILGGVAHFRAAVPGTILLNQIDSRNIQNAACGSTDPVSVPVGYNNISDPANFTLKWGLQYWGYQVGSGPIITGGASDYYLMMTRTYVGASLLVAGAHTLPGSYAALYADQLTQPITFWFRSPTLQRASITVDEAGGITRAFQ